MTTGDILVREGIISDYNNVPAFFDEPKFYTIVGDIADPSKSRVPLFVDDPQLGKVGGTSFVLERAQLKFVGEAIERFSLVPNRLYDNYGSYRSLLGRGLVAVDPNSIVRNRGITAPEDGRYGWYAASQMATGDEIFVPSHLVDVPAVLETGDRFLRDPITTGAASHVSDVECQLAALYEVWERELLLCSWLTASKPTRIAFATGLPAALQTLVDHVARYRLEVDYFELGAPTGFHAFICNISDPTGVVPFTIGAAFHDNPVTALIKATEEAVQIRPWLRVLRSDQGNVATGLSSVRDRALWTLTDTCGAAVKDWLDGCPPYEMPDLAVSDERRAAPATLLAELLAETVARGGTPILVQLTDRLPVSLRQTYVAGRVLVPEFQPLYFNELERPAVIHLLNAKVSNDVPHPFV